MNRWIGRSVLLAVILLITSCGTKKPNEAIINARIDGASGALFILQELGTRELKPLDSVKADAGGAFRITLKPAAQGFYLLEATNRKVLVITLSPGDEVTIGGSYMDYPDRIIIKGSEENRWLQEFYAFTRIQERQVDSLELLLAAHQDSADYYDLTVALEKDFREIWERQRLYERQFIDRHPAALSSLLVLNYAFGMSPVLSPVEDSTWYLRLDSNLFPRFPENPHVQYHRERINEYRRQQSLKGSPR